MPMTKTEKKSQNLNKAAKVGHFAAKVGIVAGVGLPLLTLSTAIKSAFHQGYIGEVVRQAMNMQQADPFVVNSAIVMWAGIACVVALSGSKAIEKMSSIQREGADAELNKGKKTKYLDVDYEYLKSASNYTLLSDVLNKLKTIGNFWTKSKGSKPKFLHKFDKYGLEQINVIHALTALAKLKPEAIKTLQNPTMNDPAVKTIFKNADNLMELLAENTPNLSRFASEMKQAIGDKAAFIFSDDAYDSHLGADKEYTKIIDESLTSAIRKTKEFTVFAAFSKHMGDLIHEKTYGNLGIDKMKHFLKGFQEVDNLREYVDVHYTNPMANNPTFPQQKIGRGEDLSELLRVNQKIISALEKAIEKGIENPSLGLPQRINKVVKGYDFESFAESHPSASTWRRNYLLKSLFKDTIPKGKTLEGAFIEEVCATVKDKIVARLEKTKNAPNPHYKQGQDKKSRAFKINDPKEMADNYMADILGRIAGKRYEKGQMNMHKSQIRKQVIRDIDSTGDSKRKEIKAKNVNVNQASSFEP